MLSVIVGLSNPSFDYQQLTIPTAYAQELSWEESDIQKLEQCESDGSTTVVILDVNHKYSYGILMFQMGTWLRYKALGTTPQNILDPTLQETVATYMLDNANSTGGLWNWENCAIKTGLLPSSES